MKSVMISLGIIALSTGCSVMGSSGEEGSQGSGEWEHPDYDSTMIVSNVTELLDAVEYANASGNVEILLEDGTYQLDGMLWIDGYNVGFRGYSGDFGAVIIRGEGMTGGDETSSQ